MISRELMDLLCCPLCKGGLTEEPAALKCVPCGRSYPVVDGIPDLVP